MKKCSNPDCGRILGETVTVCPGCGSRLVPGLERIDDYILLETIQETYAGIHFRARPKDGQTEVMLRLYPKETVFSKDEAGRIDRELTEVSTLSRDSMVQHIGLHQSGNGQWYRLSEWIGGVSWGDFIASRFFRDPHRKREWIDLFIQMAEALRLLHDSGRIMPHLALSDLILFHDENGRVSLKLDYKTSPIPQTLDQIPVHLKHLAGHPDLIAERALDRRSDVWTLGRLMLELLLGTDEIEDCQGVMDGIYHRFEPIVLHRKLSGLLRVMIEDDPDKRPSSMSTVLEGLRSITDDDIAKWDQFAHDPTRKKKLGKTIRHYTIAAACLVLLFVISLNLYQRWHTREEMERISEGARRKTELSVRHSLKGMLPEQRMTTLTEKYRRSVAFVLVTYHLTVDDLKIPVGGGTGTAFLVSSDGYLLTNRHVACPWLSDSRLEVAFQKAKAKKLSIKLGYDLYVWFDGDQAFRTVAGIGSSKLEDSYRIGQAYRSDGQNGKMLKIMGVMPAPQRLAEIIEGLQDDVAVIKVTPPPDDAVLIPLREYEKGNRIHKGASVFTLGFPHGKTSIVGETAVSRCTDGTISRVFENMITTNADLHPGNSGGPVIDMDGLAVGIASAVFSVGSDKNKLDPQSSMGRVLPIEKARILLDRVRAGVPQWTGMPTFALEATLENARNAALAGNRDEALRIMDGLIAEANHPDLYFWAGIISVKGDALTSRGKKYLENALAMEPESGFYRFLLYRADFLAGVAAEKRAFRSNLRALDWRHPQELFGYLVRILEGDEVLEKALLLGDAPEEEAFIYWTAACVEKTRGTESARAGHLRAALAASEQDTALAFLIQSEMLEAGITQETDKKPSSAKDTAETMSSEDLLRKALEGDLKPAQDASASRSRLDLIQEMFNHASNSRWREAFERSETYLALPQRESANMLGAGLLRCQFLYLLGDKQRADAALRDYARQIRDPWYQRLAGCLAGEVTEDALRSESRGNQEKTLTLATALGLKAEADGNTAKAIECYNDALDSGLNNWLEFQLAEERRQAIRSENQKQGQGD